MTALRGRKHNAMGATSHLGWTNEKYLAYSIRFSLVSLDGVVDVVFSLVHALVISCLSCLLFADLPIQKLK